MHHEMQLRPGPFEMIADGRKTYELRLHDAKRRLIAVGDEITFTNTDDGRQVRVCVTSLQPFSTFAELYAALPLTACGYTPENLQNASPRDMEAYYPPEAQQRHGVLAIGVQRIRYPLAGLSEGFTVRELTQADLPALLHIARSNPLYYQHMGVQPDMENLAADLTALPPRCTLADKHFFGWFQGEEMVGAMDLIARYPDGQKAFIGWFILDAAHQGKGLGRRLIADVLRMLENQGVAEVRLGRIVGNAQSERFWQACGFADNGLRYDTDGYTVAVMARAIKNSLPSR